ncbi:MAG: hypothetical protein QGG63_01780 [Candidatus Pacebacteria bacterium]|jgi:hypothetical protein|nr:hypothetical protein [Candidatus Paceibacterota bacterium]|tara:strand:- start:1444 stop:2331 length:888 start_codon:yes stop_codon:yes gene_type:complete
MKNIHPLNLFGQNKIVSVIILIIVITAVVLTVRQYTGANTDRICVRTVSDESQCSNGSWGNWTVISQETNDGITTTTEERTYMGTRRLQNTIQFVTSIHNYSCSIGGGRVTMTSEVAVCQVIETRVATSGGAGGVGGSGSEVGTDELEPVTTTTTSEFTAPTTVTVTETVTLRTIEADFMCSINKEDWRGCEEEIKVPKRTTPIYLKSFVESATSWDWWIEDNKEVPLSEGQSIGTFQNPNSEMTQMDLEYGAGNIFTKEVTLSVEGEDRFGLSANGSATKTLNITIVDIQYMEI